MAGLFEDEMLPDEPTAPGGPSLFGDDAAPAAAPAYRVLARKYRPRLFGDLIGQDALVRTLRNAFAMDRIAHAFMLTGVRGVGKTTTARILARALNCIGPDGTGGPTPDPCGVCEHCVAILADRHPDVVEMDAASHTGVDDVREIIEATRFRPLSARMKMFIVDEVHMLSRNAFNALLKTLEEPPPHIKFVLATTEIRKVPVTVLSRCQRFDLRRVPVDQLTAHFIQIAAAEAVKISAPAANLIARAADGSVRDGLSLLDQAIALGSAGEGEISAAMVEDMLGLADRGLVFEMMEAVVAGDAAAALGVADAAHAAGADLGVVLGDMLALAHLLTRIKSAPSLVESAALPEAERTRGVALAARLSVPILGRLWQMLLKGVAEVEAAPDRRAAVEMILIRLCHVADLPPPGELVRRLIEGGAAPTGSAIPPAAPSPAATPPPPSGGGGARAVAGGTAALAVPAEPPAPVPVAREKTFSDVVALAAAQHDVKLYAHLRHDVHLVRFAPPVIELRLTPDAPRDLAARLSALLETGTGRRWTIVLSQEAGAPTIDAAEAAANRDAATAAAAHPLVLAILETFPGAKIERMSAAVEDDGPPPDWAERTPPDEAYHEEDFEG